MADSRPNEDSREWRDVATRDASAENAERDTDRDLAERNGHAPALVDPEDEPSAAWGWHGDFPRGKIIAGWISVGILIAFNFTNNNADGYTQNLYLCGLALLMAIGLILHARRKRTPWRR